MGRWGVYTLPNGTVEITELKPDGINYVIVVRGITREQANQVATAHNDSIKPKKVKAEPLVFSKDGYDSW